MLFSVLFTAIVAIISAAKSADISKQLRPSSVFAHSCNCCVCFAIDESGSINATEWEDEVNFVLNLAELHNSFNMGRAKYSAVAFESNPASTVIVGLTSSYPVFSSAVAGYTRNSGGTNIEAGLLECQRMLRSRVGRSCDARTIVLLTDGFGSVSDISVNDIKSSGTNIITIGIGSSVNTGQLQSIASDPSCVFGTSFPALNSLRRAPIGTSPFVQNVCTKPLLNKIATKFCKKKLRFTISNIPVFKTS